VRQFSRSNPTLDLSTRISVHAGEIYLGNMGAGDHYTYGPTGDTVNTASRMDGLNKYLGTRILVSEEVLRDVDGFLTREAGRFKLKGKTHAVEVHELVCHRTECKEKQKEACGMFAWALVAFKRRSWDEARSAFQRCIAILGRDDLSNFYLNLCTTYEKNSPAEPWDGVILMEEK